VKYSLLLACVLVVGQTAFGQSVTTSYTTDLNGNRIAGPTTVANDGQKTQIMQSINGRKVPMEQTEERVIRENASGKVVEKIIKKFDPNGALASTERVVIEEEKLYDGLRQHSTTYRSDVNGNMHEAERRTAESHKQGSAENTQSELARPDINGSFQTVEKRTIVTQAAGAGSQEDETVFRRSDNGGFYPAVRDITDTTQSGSQTVQKSAHYEPSDSQQLKLIGQTVSTIVKRADGSSVAEVSLYGASAGDGRAHDGQSGMHLREQQTIEKIAGAGGSVTEVVTARRPTTSDPNRLGPAVKISETVCTGKCTPDPKK
jgi:hypothetical protein